MPKRTRSVEEVNEEIRRTVSSAAEELNKITGFQSTVISSNNAVIENLHKDNSERNLEINRSTQLAKKIGGLLQ
jgi:hypothetical protein